MGPPAARLLERAGARAERLVRRCMPDPFVLVLLLTLLALGAAAALSRAGLLPPRPPERLLAVWQAGFAELLAFAMQMVLIVVTGEAIVAAPTPRRWLVRVADLPSSAPAAVALVAGTAMLLGFLHWGGGLIAAALLAREVGLSCRRRGVRVHYALLGSAAYMSMLLWHAGTTASAPLLINTPGHFLEREIGIVPLSETIFTRTNLLACGALLLLVPALLARMAPRDPAAIVEVPASLDASAAPAAPSADTAPVDASSPAARLDRSRLPSLATGALGIAISILWFRERGADLNHNVVNFLLLSIGLCLHESPTAYARAIASSVKGTSGVILQFPFYGGIMAVLRDTGLGHLVAEQFVALATRDTLPLCAYLASVATKLFIPSGGGEWAVEGPVMIQAAKALGASVGKTTMGIAYGNMVGNLFQPFWAIPLLAILHLEARAIMGYGLVVFVLAFPLLGVALLL